MSSTYKTDYDLDDIEDIDITLMTLRKPTELKKVIDSVPKPVRAVPKNGLPVWYRLGLENKLPMPKTPAGKIVFSRGKIGEDVRRVGLGQGGKRPTFDLSDPYCNDVSYDYVALHDPHLAHHFAQQQTKKRMLQLGFCTKDDRAVCSLKEFNQYRKYLYNQYMDRIHMEIEKLNERARDDLTLKRVAVDVARREQVFIRTEKAREHLESVFRENADEWAEKKRAAKEQQKRIQARIAYLAEFKEKQRVERAARALEKAERIKQRVQLAEELELRRKITMVRQWRSNERKRLNRLKMEREAKKRRVEEEANRKWKARVEAQNAKIQEEELLLKIYTEDMSASAQRRMKKAEIYAYNTDLELQCLRLANWKAGHGGTAKAAAVTRKMGIEFEKSKRGAKGMSLELAQELAQEAMAVTVSTPGDVLMALGQARYRMEIVTILPPAPIKILEEILEHAIFEFARGHVHRLLRDVQRVVRARASAVFFKIRPKKHSGPKPPRWSLQVAVELARHLEMPDQGNSISFGDTCNIPVMDETEIEGELKSVKNRPPTPVPSLTKLVEVTFSDRVEDLTEPITHGLYLPERRKLLEMVNTSAKILSKSVSQRVMKGIDIDTGKVVMPYMKHSMEWGEAVEGLAMAVVDNRVQPDSADIRRTAIFLACRILKSLIDEVKRGQKPRYSNTSENYVMDDDDCKLDFYEYESDY